VPGVFQRSGEDSEITGDLACDGGTDFCGVKRERVEPDPAQACADVCIREIRESDTETARVRKG